MSETEHLHPPQEPDTPSSRWIAGLGAAVIAITVVLALIAVRLVRRHGDAFGGSVYPRDIRDPLRDPALDSPLEFHLFETDPPGEGRRAQQAARERLESWGWVDREAGTVHLPIDVAMEVVAPTQESP